MFISIAPIRPVGCSLWCLVTVIQYSLRENVRIPAWGWHVPGLVRQTHQVTLLYEVLYHQVGPELVPSWYQTLSGTLTSCFWIFWFFQQNTYFFNIILGETGPSMWKYRPRSTFCPGRWSILIPEKISSTRIWKFRKFRTVTRLTEFIRPLPEALAWSKKRASWLYFNVFFR